jgi:hypothetical protein
MNRLLARTFPDPQLQLAWQQLVSEWGAAMNAGLFANAVFLDGVVLSTSDTPVFHNLGRPPTMLFARMLNANATVFSITPHATPRTHINVRASAAVTANLVIG